MAVIPFKETKSRAARLKPAIEVARPCMTNPASVALLVASTLARRKKNCACMYWLIPELSQGGGEGMFRMAQFLHSALLLMKPMTVLGKIWSKLPRYALQTEFQ